MAKDVSCEHCGVGFREAERTCDHCGDGMCPDCTRFHDDANRCPAPLDP